MSLIPFSLFPRRMFDTDTWLPSTFTSSSLWPSTFSSSSLMPSNLLSPVDFFDPFDELDRMMSRNLQWINQPASILPVAPTVPRKHRIAVDCAGFSGDSIKTDIKDQQGQRVLNVHASEESGRPDSDDYSKRELHKTFKLPENIDHDKMASFMAPGGRFVVEFPLKETDTTPNLGLLPQIKQGEGGRQQVEINFPLPQNVDPNNVQVSVKDRDLIMRVEQRNETDDQRSRTYMYTRTTLPDTTDFNQLKCMVDNNRLQVTAPISQNVQSNVRNIPLEFKQQQGQQQIQGGQQQQGQQQGQQGQQQMQM